MALEDYNRVEWKDGTSPAINAANLSVSEYGIERVTKAVQVLEDNPYTLPPATEANLGGVMIKVIDNGDGTFTGEIWT